MDAQEYGSIAETLCQRIVTLAKSDPQKHDLIMELDDAWGLFKIEGFACDDLGPSLAQAQGAFSKAKAILRRGG